MVMFWISPRWRGPRTICASKFVPYGVFPLVAAARMGPSLRAGCSPASGSIRCSARRRSPFQTVGSSGGLKVGADFLKTWLPGAQVWVSDPTWDNHRSMFEGSGFVVNTYPYHDPAAGGLRFDAMLTTLHSLPRRSIVLLHACCHNPTGVDLSAAQ